MIRYNFKCCCRACHDGWPTQEKLVSALLSFVPLFVCGLAGLFAFLCIVFLCSIVCFFVCALLSWGSQSRISHGSKIEIIWNSSDLRSLSFQRVSYLCSVLKWGDFMPSLCCKDRCIKKESARRHHFQWDQCFQWDQMSINVNMHLGRRKLCQKWQNWQRISPEPRSKECEICLLSILFQQANEINISQNFKITFRLRDI